MKKRSSSQKSQKATVKTKGTPERVTIGMDLGDKTSRYCMLSSEGEILREGQVMTTKAGMAEAFGSLGRARIAIEVGTHSPWVSRLLQKLGHEMVVANPKQVKLITESSRKDDRLDAQTLARLARIGPQLLRPIQHRTEKIKDSDREIEQIARKDYPETALLQQVGGVGPLIALTFVLTVEDKGRFQKSRDIGCYVGLRPRRSDSGQSQPQLRITKEGDPYLRTMLVQGAHYVISPPGTGYRSEAMGLAPS